MSTRHGIAVGVIALLCGACASTHVTESDRLRAQAAYDRALSQLQERQLSPALAALKEAVAVDPTVAVELDPRLADAQFHLGTAYAESRRWEDAVAAYRNALALPTLAIPDFVHQNLGLALYHLKRYPEAESSLRFALSLDPKLQAAYYNLGLVLVAENRAAEARAAFRQARQLAPETPFGQAARERLKSLGEGG